MAKRKQTTDEQRKNLVSLADRPESERKAIASKGGKKSQELRKERRLMSMILIDYLAKNHTVETRSDKGDILDTKKMTTDELVDYSITAALARGDSASISAIKTIGELTEGKTIKLLGDEENPLAFKYVEPPKNASPKDI